MQTNNFLINRIPLRTWERFKVNEKNITINTPLTNFNKNITTNIPEQILINNTPTRILKNYSLDFSSVEYEQFITENATLVHNIIIPSNLKIDEPLNLTIDLPTSGNGLACDIEITIQKNAKATLFINYRSQAEVEANFYGRINILCEENSSFELITNKIFRGKSTFYENVNAVLEESSSLQIIAAELAKTDFVTSVDINLQGDHAQAKLDVMYIGSANHVLDMAYRVKHIGKNTNSSLTGKGILLNEAKKTFRDTIDFVKGSAGSKASEAENILVLDQRVQNISVPLLLCGECDVEGAHAVSVGKPEEKILFYLMSRGISQKEAEIILAQAALASINDNIPSTSLQEEIRQTIQNLIYEGEKL